MLEDDQKFGFIVIDGNGALFAYVQGNSQSILQKYSVSLPRKHNKGGQSAPRFQRLRLIAQHTFLTKVSEMASQNFLDPTTTLPNVSGLILAGSAAFKDKLIKMLDQRLQTIVMDTVDVAYGGLQGLNQAIELSSGLLKDVALVQQRKVISQFFHEIEMDSGKYCFGAKDTMQALEMGASQKLMVWEDLQIMRHTIIHPADPDEKIIVYSKTGVSPLAQLEKDHQMESENEQNVAFQIESSVSMVEFLSENYKKYGTEMQLVSDATSEGSQFCRGFGGIGAILRYRVEFSSEEDIQQKRDLEKLDEEEDEDYWD